MRTMADMRNEQDASKGNGKGKKGVESYSGGERSGMAVYQPGQDGAPPDPTDPFAAARAAGAVDTSGNMGPVEQTVTIYQDGFTINDGVFRPLTDPANKKFYDDIHAGQCPDELRALQKDGQPVGVAVKDKRNEKYSPPGPGMSGAGPSSRPIVPGSANLADGSTAGPTATGTAEVSVDESKPTTSIMIRFGDGRRVTQTFNEDGLVQELWDYVVGCTGTEEFKLIEGFPPKPIIDRTKTFKEAGLLKAQVVVKN